MRERRKDPEFREHERKAYKERRDEIVKWFNDYRKILCCEVCKDERDYVLEFHHHVGDKEHSISRMVFSSYSKKTILQELMKCKVLCANCHKEYHYRERGKK